MGRIHLLSVLFCVLMDDAISLGERPSILLATRKSVVSVDPETQVSTTIISGLNRSVAVDYHHQRALVVWTDVETEKIYSSPIAGGTEKKVLVDVCVTPDGVAVDWVHDNIYWTDAEKDLIGVARLLDGSFHKTLVDKNIQDPRAIVLHLDLGLMFWTDWGSFPKIERAGMDGTQRTAIVSSGLRWPNGLALDLPSQRVYWIDGSTQVLSSSNYDGKEERVIITPANSALRHPFSLDILGDWLYWTEWGFNRQGLYKVNKNMSHHDVVHILSGKNWSTLMGLKAYDRSKQPPGVNRCVANGGCTHLCLPAPGEVTYSCACPDGVLPSDNCSTTPIESLLNSTNERRNQEEPVAASSIPAGTIVGIIIGIAALASVTFYMHRIFSKRFGRAAVESQGWTGIDNPVYHDTAQQHRESSEKATTDSSPGDVTHIPQHTSEWMA